MNNLLNRKVSAIVAALIPFVTVAAQITPAQTEVESFTVEVSENGSRFVFVDAPILENGLSAYGNPYLTRGYIYPEGTLLEGVSGTLADGRPAFPNKVLGEWTRWGYQVRQGAAHFQSVPVVTTFELFEFNERHGEETIVLGGVTMPGTAAPMPVLGRTGSYACGEADQETLRFEGATNSFSLRYTFNAGSCIE